MRRRRFCFLARPRIAAIAALFGSTLATALAAQSVERMDSATAHQAAKDAVRDWAAVHHVRSRAFLEEVLQRFPGND